MQNFASPPLSAPFLLFLANDQQRRQEPLHPQTVFAMARKEEQTLPPQEDQTILEHREDDDDDGQEVDRMNEEEQEWDESSLHSNNTSSSSAQGGIQLGTSSLEEIISHAHFIMQQAQRGMLHPLADEDFREMELRLQAMRDIGLRFHGRLGAGVSSPAEEGDIYDEEEDAPRRNE
ncbi:hypothetical protein QOT17_016357 [Balamuthia mandrillaris]